MRENIEKNLSIKISAPVVFDILNAYEGLMQKYRAVDHEAALTRAGKFVEHIFRALEFIRTGKAPSEIKSPAATVKQLENDVTLPDSIRFLIPRIAVAMIYDLRSKRGAVHVKEIDPRGIDVGLSVKAASWIIAELIRLYHVENEVAIELEMASLTRSSFPLLENIGGEHFVSKKVPPKIEIQLLLAKRIGEGCTRAQLGKMAKCGAPSVTKALQELVKERFVHRTEAKIYHLTGSGEADLGNWLSSNVTA